MLENDFLGDRRRRAGPRCKSASLPVGGAAPVFFFCFLELRERERERERNGKPANLFKAVPTTSAATASTTTTTVAVDVVVVVVVVAAAAAAARASAVRKLKRPRIGSIAAQRVASGSFFSRPIKADDQIDLLRRRRSAVSLRSDRFLRFIPARPFFYR